ncbi:MAG: hypothetical protein ABIY50_05155 [Ignavibacteria bacterium]
MRLLKKILDKAKTKSPDRSGLVIPVSEATKKITGEISKNSKVTNKKTISVSRSEHTGSHGIGYFVEKARNNNFVLDEFISTADSYFHYSNYIIFEISKGEPVHCLLFIIIDSSGTIAGLLLIALNKSGRRSYPGFKENAKIFEGVIERYCGVPP